MSIARGLGLDSLLSPAGLGHLLDGLPKLTFGVEHELPGGHHTLAFGQPLPGAGCVFNLSETRDLTEAAARLFAGLRWLDREGQNLGLRDIAAMSVPDTGLGLAINDRLQRAAAPRSS